jgi:molybdate transport system substrate-binding protein
MRFITSIGVALAAIALASPGTRTELHVAAAANLTRVLQELATSFEHRSSVHVVPSYGATAQLAQQIENGAPFDVFLSADVEHVDELIRKNIGASDSRMIYARGELVVWAPNRPDLHTIQDLAKTGVRNIVIAKPELAPYGAAAIETLRKSGLWERIERNVVYAPSISIAKQFADTGNGDAAFTALALVTGERGNFFLVPENLHKPIDQAVCINKSSKEAAEARQFLGFLAGAEGRAILKRFGYGQP